MCFEDMANLQPLGACHFHIAFAVAARIDDGCLAARTNQVGQVGQAGCLDFLEQHDASFDDKKLDRREPILLSKDPMTRHAQSFFTGRK